MRRHTRFLILALLVSVVFAAVGPTLVAAATDYTRSDSSISKTISLTSDQALSVELSTTEPNSTYPVDVLDGSGDVIYQTRLNESEVHWIDVGSYADYKVKVYGNVTSGGISLGVDTDDNVQIDGTASNVDNTTNTTDSNNDSDGTYTGTGTSAYTPGECTASHYLRAGISNAMFGTSTEGLVCNGDKWTGADTYADAVELYQHAVSVHAQDIQFRNLIDNYLQDTEEMAFMAAEKQIAEAAKNGTTQSYAVTEAKQAVQNYFTTKQRNLLDHWNMQVSAYQGLNSSDSYSSVSIRPKLFIENQTTESGYSWDPYATVTVGSKNITLFDGSNYTVKTLKVTLYARYSDGTYYANNTEVWYPGKGEQNARIDYSDSYRQISIYNTGIKVHPPSGYDPVTFIWYEGYTGDWNALKNQFQGVHNDVENFTRGVWADVAAGAVNPDDILSRVNQMYSYTVQGTGENISFNEGIAGLIASGFSTPLLTGNTSYMTATFTPASLNTTITKDGMLLSSQGPPNGSWQVNKTYNVSNMTGVVMYLTLDGYQYTLEGNMTISAVYGTNGTVVENPNLYSPHTSYSVSNTTELQNLVTTLGERIESLENITSTYSGGGGGPSDDGFSLSGILPDLPIKWLGIALLALFVLIILAYGMMPLAAMN